MLVVVVMVVVNVVEIVQQGREKLSLFLQHSVYVALPVNSETQEISRNHRIDQLTKIDLHIWNEELNNKYAGRAL